jgi:hypothetical protein
VTPPARTGALRVTAVLAAVLATGCLALAPPPEFRPGAFRERTVVLSVEGTPGLAFEGSYGTPSKSIPARGTVPAQYSVRTSIGVVGSFTKTAAEGVLVVRILVDGQELQRRGTSAAFGTVVISQRFSK